MRIITRIRVALSWREIWRSNHWAYQENAITKKRRVDPIPQSRGQMSPPPDFGWLEGEEPGAAPMGRAAYGMMPPCRPSR